MADGDQGEKTEAPTDQRREDFRKKGQVAQTKELITVLVLFSSLLSIWLMGRFFFEQIYLVFTKSFGEFLIHSGRGGHWSASLEYAVNKAFVITGPILGVMWVVSVTSSVLQVGFLNNEEALQLKFDRLNPINGFKRIFSLRSLVEGAKAFFKISIVGAIVVTILKYEASNAPQLIYYSIEQLMKYFVEVTFKLVGAVGFLMSILAGLDFLFQKWDTEEKMKMTKQEVKEEHKTREGDPLIKSRIRRIQREMANRRMMGDVPKADVIITNPTHISIALKYDATLMAPIILAKGADQVAMKIRELAKEHDIPLVENKPLARTIYKTVKIGQYIPKELYVAVAEVLSFVFKLKKKKRVY